MIKSKQICKQLNIPWRKMSNHRLTLTAMPRHTPMPWFAGREASISGSRAPPSSRSDATELASSLPLSSLLLTGRESEMRGVRSVASEWSAIVRERERACYLLMVFISSVAFHRGYVEVDLLVGGGGRGPPQKRRV